MEPLDDLDDEVGMDSGGADFNKSVGHRSL
jgi:hypothetical protein